MTEAFNIKGILKDVSDKLGEFQKKMQEATDAGKSFTDVIKECVPAPVIAAIGALSAIIVGTLVAALDCHRKNFLLWLFVWLQAPF